MLVGGLDIDFSLGHCSNSMEKEGSGCQACLLFHFLQQAQIVSRTVDYVSQFKT